MKVTNSVLNPNRLELAKNEKPYTIIVEGNIACGKTTFLNHFRQWEQVCVVPEPVDGWRDCRGHNLFDLMYKDTSKWAFPFQSYVTLTMLQSLRLPTNKPIKLVERSLYSARYCFVEKMVRDNLIHPPACAVLDEWYNWIHDNLDINVDLIVYLRCSPRVSYDRMQQRNRKEERSVSFEYIKELHELHEDWLYHKKSFKLPAPVLTLNAELDLSIIRNEYQKLEKCILNRSSLPV